ncbi:MAG: reductive dehalogenase [Candidatus Thorarchaeota archaeon]
MQVNMDICNPSSCKIDCLEACQSVHGVDSPLSFQKGQNTPIIDFNTCTVCLACVRACPLNAIITSHRERAGTAASTTPTSCDVTEYCPYDVAESFERMSEADTIFARVQYDSEFQYYHQTEFFGAEHMISKGIPGYGRFEHELSVAAWKLYDSRQSIVRPGIGLDPEGSEVGERRITEPTELTQMVKKAARFFGADLVGIAPLNRDWLYTVNRRGEPYDISEFMKYVIVMAIEMDYDAIAASPTFTSAATTALGYSTMAFVEVELAALIQRLGFNAITCGNNVSLSVPQAIDAGLGQYGRHGILITKQFGPRVRLAKVITDMPLTRDYPDEGFCKSVIRFCETCEKCAINCPSQSIPYGKEQSWEGETISNNPGIKKWFVNGESCYGFWVANGSECSNCIRSCPYNKKDGFLHRTILWFVKHVPLLNRLIVKMDDLVGYGKQKDGARFWKKFR